MVSKTAHNLNSRRRRFSFQRKLTFSIFVAVVSYAIVETISTALYSFGTIEPPTSVWVVEKPQSGRLFRFDAIRGYWLSPTTTRVACFDGDKLVEFDSFRGNNYGFPDRDDFEVKRPNSKTRRIAVFGDSYSAAQFLERNWPDRVEDLARQQGIDLQLLNFSVDGGGLANWWSILTRIVEAEGFELDGVIFAVFEDDLIRTFHWRDDHFDAISDDDINIFMGYTQTWDPASYPSKLDRNPENIIARVIIQSPERFQHTVQNRQIPNARSRFRLFIAHRARVAFARLMSPSTSAEPFVESFDATAPWSRAHLISDIARSIRSTSLPSIMVYVPYRSPGLTFDVHDATRVADALDATLLNGAAAYDSLNPDEIAALWTGPNQHWNQEGSDIFARYMLQILKEWPRGAR